MMFHKVKSVVPLMPYQLLVHFVSGDAKTYDLEPLFERWPAFQSLRDIPKLFELVRVDAYGKLKNGIDVQKFGKQWVITREAMEREYGQILE